MSDGIQFSINGLDELLAKFAGVSEEMSGSAANLAARDAAQYVAKQAWKRAMYLDDRESAEKIARNIYRPPNKFPGVRKKSKKFLPSDAVGYRVGVLGGAGGNRPTEDFADLPGGDTRHWRFLEFGSENNKATPFLRPALAESAQKVVAIFVKSYDERLEKAVKRRNRIIKKRTRFQNARRQFFGLD